jgi:hypothetical protein
MLAAGWPDHDSIEGGLIDPVDPMVVTKLFEGVEPFQRPSGSETP